MNILIIDDMPMQVHMLENHLHNARPQDKLWTAYNGTGAVQIVRENQIDLVLSDIRMPQTDGLGLLRQLRHATPNTRIVFITAYALFEYAKEALQQGATDFLVKPVDLGELDMKLNTWEQDINREKLERDSQEHQQRSYILARWLDEPLDCLQAEECELLRKHLQSGWLMDIWTAKDQNNLLLDLCTACGRLLGRETLAVSVHGAHRQRQLIVLQGSRSIQNELMTYLRFWRENATVRMGLSAWQSDLVTNGQNARLMCQRALNETFFASKRIEICDIAEPMPLPLLPSPNELLHLCSISAAERQTGIDVLLSRLYKQMPDVSQMLEQTVLRFAQAAEQASIGTTNALQTFSSELRRVYDWVGYKKQIRQYIAEFSATLTTFCADPMLLSIMYLKRHYGEAISLHDAAQRACMSPSYFSTMFKKHTGQGFVEYLTDLRLESAAEQLRRTDETVIYEIAEKCGYSDTRYFIRQFQKRFGVTPTQYRRLNRKDDMQ